MLGKGLFVKDCKLIYCFPAIDFAFFQHGVRKVGMIDRIREALCFQTESTVSRISNKALAVRCGVLVN